VALHWLFLFTFIACLQPGSDSADIFWLRTIFISRFSEGISYYFYVVS
jgi:hypothetical protein